MDSSSSSLSSDWDIVNSTLVISEESIEESPHETASNECANDEEEPPTGSGVDDIHDADAGHLNDSNSSSDIDVIEETAEDLMRMSIPSLEYSMNSSLSVGSLVTSPDAPDVEERLNTFQLIQSLLSDPQYRDYLVVCLVSVIFIVSTITYQGTPADKMKEMKEQVDELIKENTDLRNHMISSKVEDNKLFLILEEQIKALKIENHKLGNSLQSLITHLEEQTAVFKKEHEMRQNDPYKKEIDKLKEQVNLLEIDNDELQKQLVRMRYGAYAPNSDNTKENESGKQEDKPVKNKDPNEKVSNVLTEEIEKLKTKLYSEVDELKEWKEAINDLIKRLNEKEKGNTENEDSFENKKTSEEKFGKHTKEENNGRSNKEQKWSDWSWKDLKKNFKDTFDNINVSDMFSKYTPVDEKKVKGYFDSVNHYFKKAQEKTKKILNFKDKGKDEVWSFLGDLRKKWADMKDEFFKSHYKNGPVPPDGDKNEQKREHASSFSDKTHQFEKRKNPSHFETKDQQSNKEQTSQNNPKKDEIPTLESLINDPKLKHIMEKRYGPGWQAEMKKYIEEQNLDGTSNENQAAADDMPLNEDQAKKPEGSWMFNRAEGRSVLREHDEQEDSTNWYLRRKKTAKGDFEAEFYDAF